MQSFIDLFDKYRINSLFTVYFFEFDKIDVSAFTKKNVFLNKKCFEFTYR